MQTHQLAGDILGDAFFHYPLMVYAFEGKTEEERSKALHHLYRHCAKAAAMYGGVVLTPDKQGALIWLSGKHFPLGILREAKSGMAVIPFKIGVKPTLRLMHHDSVPEGWIAKNAGEKMGYIWCLGVAANQRGKGLSRTLIDQSSADMRAQGINAFWLKTEDPKNVLIYQKLGFDIVYETVVESSGIKSWVMKK